MNKKKSITTIKLEQQTKQRLEKLKETNRETYDDILRKMLYILSIVKIDPDKAQDILENIDEARKRNIQEKKKD